MEVSHEVKPSYFYVRGDILLHFMLEENNIYLIGFPNKVLMKLIYNYSL